LDFGIDLAAVDLDVPPTLYQGAPAAASVVIANLHRASLGPFRFVLRLGPESGAPGGTTVHTSAPLTLGPYEQRAVPVPFDLPPAASVGRYALALEIDSQSSIVEVDEANNRVTRSVAIRPGVADLAPVSLTVTTTAAAAGQRLYVDARLANVGVRTASGAEALVLLSGNPVITDRDLTLARFSVDLAAGASRTTSVAVDLPAGLRSGRYYVGLLADPSDAIPELSESNNGGAATSLVVNGAGLSVVSALLPRGVVGSVYLALLEAAGASDPVTWSVASGALPLGLTLTAESGLISGVPLGAGAARIVVRARAGTASATAALDLEILDPAIPLAVATRALPAAYLGLEYEVQLTSAGGATSTRTWGATGLPDRFTLDASGLLHGLPIAAGSATIAVSVGDGVATASRELRLEILSQGRILLEPTPLPPGTLGEPYQGAISAAGGTPPLVFALESGALPRGLSLSDDGQISGLPEEVGRFTMVVSVRDAETTSPADLGSYNLLIQDRPLLVVTTETLPTAHRGEAYEAVIESARGTAPVRWRISEGSLPAGIAAEEVAASGTLRLHGTPEATEVAAFEVEVVDAVGRRATRVLALEVAPPRQLNVSGGCSCGVQRGRVRLSPALFWLAILIGLGARRRLVSRPTPARSARAP
ncbi:MAG: putative Ig domain-containing protein, partial [Deltaproteobacteria bacterium]|nr:putative Ig domain-containing protein [Deltaproteobacteria bacterium]